MSVKKRVELMISTMDRKDTEWLNQLHISTPAVVINQCGKNSQYMVECSGRPIKWVDSDEKGLSRSRNLALKNASEEYVVLTDDDVEYVSDYEEIITSAFERYPNADIIAFQVEGIEEPFKSYSAKNRQLGYLSSLHVSSVEIVLRRESIVQAGLKFQEEFGAGAMYRMGEENIFLYDCLKKNLKLYYVPEVIARLHIGDSTWFEGYTEKFFQDQGAIYHRMFGRVWGRVMICVYGIKNYRKYKRAMTFCRAMRNMACGYKQYVQ